MLQKTFKEVDTAGSGFLKLSQIKAIFETLANSGEEEIAIPKQHLDAILFAMDMDENENVEYSELAQSWTGVLNHITKEAILQELVHQRSVDA